MLMNGGTMTSSYLSVPERDKIFHGVNEAIAQLEEARKGVTGFASDVLGDLIQELRDELEVVDLLTEGSVSNDN